MKGDLSAVSADVSGPTIDSMIVETTLSVDGRDNSGAGDESDSDSDDSASTDSDEEGSNRQHSEDDDSSGQHYSEDESLEVTDEGVIIESKALRKSVELDQNVYQHPYHNSLSVTSDTYSDGPFESSDDDSQNSGDNFASYNSHLQSQDKGPSYDNGSAHNAVTSDEPASSPKENYARSGEEIETSAYQYDAKPDDSGMVDYESVYQYANQPTYPPDYSHMPSEEQSSGDEQSSAPRIANYDQMQYQRGYSNDAYDQSNGRTPDQGYGGNPEWDRSQYASQEQSHHQMSQQYDYQYQYANSDNYEGEQYDYGDAASVASSRSADPPAASYRQLPMHNNRDNVGGRNEHDYNAWNGDMSDQAVGGNAHNGTSDYSAYNLVARDNHSVSSGQSGRSGNSFHSATTTETGETTLRTNVSTRPRPKSTPRSFQHAVLHLGSRWQR